MNTAVASPEPSETTTSNAGMPERGLIRTCLISPLMRTGQRMGQCLIFVTSRLSKRTWSRSASSSSTDAFSRRAMSFKPTPSCPRA